MEKYNLILSIIGIGISFIGTIFSAFAWIYSRKVDRKIKHEQQRKNKKIKIELVYGSKSYELPGEIRRAEFSRAEVLGLLGMIPMKEKGQRFVLGYLNTPKFRFRFNEILEGGNDTILQISCNEEEYNQFDFDNIQK